MTNTEKYYRGDAEGACVRYENGKVFLKLDGEDEKDISNESSLIATEVMTSPKVITKEEYESY